MAGGQFIWEDFYLVRFSFDGEEVEAIASFAPGQEVLIGTHLLRRHRLEIDFPAHSVYVERVA